MRPTIETENKRVQSMLAMQTLVKTVDIEELNQLLAGIVIAALRNPLLRMIIIDDKRYIAHVRAGAPGGICWKFDDNPLENKSSKGDLRVSIMDNSGVLLVEKNMGKIPEDEISRSIENRMSNLASLMHRSRNYLGQESSEYASLGVHMTTRSHGSTFVWKRYTAYNLSDFETLEIVKREDKTSDRYPTFDLVLKLSGIAKKSREAMSEP